MSFAISLLQDDFTNSNIDPLWRAYPFASGSGTVIETSGQAQLTPPTSTAGTHANGYWSSAVYDFTGGSCYINIAQMVSTSVAVTASYALMPTVDDQNNVLQWYQLSGTLVARKIVAGASTSLYSVAWNAATYKYLRIRESAGTIYFDSSTDGTSWTNRATTTVASTFAVTALYVTFAFQCGNVAAPGSFRLDQINTILPAPSSTWRETTADWSITNRLRPVTLASDGGFHGAIVTADTMDSSRALGGTLHYYGGPLGSSSGGYLALTEYASLALAEASPFPVPIDGRVDLPAMVDARYMRFYHRSIDASAHVLSEFVPRRIVQADDIEAESIKAINISAGAITADKIFVLNLAAVSAQMGALHMDGVIDIVAGGGIYQGTGTFASPTTGLKLFNSAGVGKLSGYNATVEQITIDTDGKFKWGAGTGFMDATGIGITGTTFSYGLYNGSPVTTPRVNMLQWSKSSGSQAASIIGSASAQLLLMADKITLAIPLSSSDNYGLNLQANGAHSMTADAFTVNFGGSTGPNALTVQTNAANGGTTTVHGGLNVGSATTVTPGQIATSGNVAFGPNIDTNTRLYVKGQGNTSGTHALVVQNSSGSNMLLIRNDNAMGFFGAAVTTRPVVSGSRAANAALASALSALATLGLVTDSSTV